MILREIKKQSGAWTNQEKKQHVLNYVTERRNVLEKHVESGRHNFQTDDDGYSLDMRVDEMQEIGQTPCVMSYFFTNLYEWMPKKELPRFNFMENVFFDIDFMN